MFLRNLLIRHGIREAVSKGTFLFKKGSSTQVLLVWKGSVLIAGPTVNHLSLSTRQQILGLRECVGQFPSQKSAFALTPLIVYSMSSHDLKKYIMDHPELRKIVLQELLRNHQHLE